MNALKKQGLRRIVMAICGRKGLNLTDEQRHGIQIDVVGKASLTDMAVPELEDMISHLRRLQKASEVPAATLPADKTANEWRFVFRLTLDRKRYGQKIYRLAEKIGALQTPAVPVMSKAYVEGIARQMRGCDQPLEFCDPSQLHKVVQALEVFVKRHGG